MAAQHFKGRTLARSQALQLVFQAEATGRSVDEVLSGDYALSEGPLDPFAERLARGTWSYLPQIDGIIKSVSTNWSIWRMPAVDRNLLRLSLYEILEVDEVELPVTIDECVELAKAYGTDESSRFVNGVLGQIARDIESGCDLKHRIEEEKRLADEGGAEPSGDTGEDGGDGGAAEEEKDAPALSGEAAASAETLFGGADGAEPPAEDIPSMDGMSE